MRFQTTLGTVSILAATLALAGCGSPETTDQTTAEAVEAAEESEPAAATSEPEQMTTEDAAPIKMDPPVKAATADPIRGPGGLESKCLARVTEQTGGAKTSTNRIEESEAAIEIYVNVEGAQALWKCLGSRDGSITEAYFTGDEGAL
ncbi:hypothetical protein [Altererythrobacter sp.]|uniref:hypothetical protein n=1 Tax=Altererythrobacter sp. TaxID=1872480 RepID=UPI003CFBCDD2